MNENMKHIKDLDKFDTLGFESYLESIKVQDKPIPSKKDPRETKEFESAFEVWKNDRDDAEDEEEKDAEDLREEFEDNLEESGLFDAIGEMLAHGLLKVHRAMSIDTDTLRHGRPLGIYWCFESESDQIYNMDGTTGEDASTVSIAGRVGVDGVDWETTFALNAVEGNEEKEIRLNKKAAVEVYEYAVKSDEFQPGTFTPKEKKIAIDPISVKC